MRTIQQVPEMDINCSRQKRRKGFSWMYVVLVLIMLALLPACGKDSPVDPPEPPVEGATSVDFYKSSLTLAVGGREKAMLITEPSNAVLLNTDWVSSNTVVAEVDSAGVIRAISPGNTVIRVTADNNISGECNVQVIECPVTDIEMPDAHFPIAKDVLLIIQGTGFDGQSKIIFRKHAGFKSTRGGEDILAQIHQVAVNYISFYCSVQPGYYNVILNQNNEEYDLGNIDVETPEIPEYEYDKNKIIWDDTHWRRFQLRGKVKSLIIKVNRKIITSSSYTREIDFNEKGYLTQHGGPESKYITTYKYDTNNRLSEIDKFCFVGIGKYTRIDRTISKFHYGKHGKYINPESIADPDFIFESYSYDFNPCRAPNDDEMFDLQMWYKDLTRVESRRYINENNVDRIEDFMVNFNVTSGEVSATHTPHDSETKRNFKWMYNGTFPYKETLTIETDATIEYTLTRLTTFDSMGTLSASSRLYKRSYESYIYDFNYVANSPFLLLSFSRQTNDCGNGIFNYDNNWNLISHESDYDENTYHYISYDKKGNWTQCIIKDTDKRFDNTYFYRITREIKYWE